MMKCSLLLGVLSLALSTAACLDPASPEVADPASSDEAVAPAADQLRPFYAASFDHEPTEAELQADLNRFVAEARAGGSRLPVSPIDPIPLPLQPGQKLVRVTAKTSDITDAGTGQADNVWFSGTWDRSSSVVTTNFFLDYPNRNDLNQNTTLSFYYVLNVGVGTQDRFLQARLYNTSTDGWHCHSVNIHEVNRLDTYRNQALPFNQWVDSPNQSPTTYLSATNTSWLSY